MVALWKAANSDLDQRAIQKHGTQKTGGKPGAVDFLPGMWCPMTLGEISVPFLYNFLF